MSISVEISDRLRRGDLVDLAPPEPDLRRRWLFLVRALADTLDKPPRELEERYDILRADLLDFVLRENLFVPSYLKQLRPLSRGVWEIKSKRDIPEVRVFGQFADTDVFIAMAQEDRDTLEMLDDRTWGVYIRRVEDTWKELFGTGFTPKKSSNPRLLFTGARILE
jgi:hypothetical protein